MKPCAAMVTAVLLASFELHNAWSPGPTATASGGVPPAWRIPSSSANVYGSAAASAASAAVVAQAVDRKWPFAESSPELNYDSDSVAGGGDDGDDGEGDGVGDDDGDDDVDVSRQHREREDQLDQDDPGNNSLYSNNYKNLFI